MLNRVWQIVRANVNALMRELEDPERILEQKLLEMQDDLIDLRQGIAEAIATQKRTERDYKQTQTIAEEWYGRAQLALNKGEEQLAREALMRRKSYLEMAIVMNRQLEQHRQIVDYLKENMRSLEGRISEAKARKDLYIARVRSVQAVEQFNQFADHFNPNNVLNIFEHLEEKVTDIEAQSQALKQLNPKEFDQKSPLLESQDVETELESLKKELRIKNEEGTGNCD